MDTRPLPPSRLFILFARKDHRAVIFRRGPSKWTQLIAWNTKQDTFEPGQWFHGRIYERRSDLSPDGRLLLYFASKINDYTTQDSSYTYAWTAISKPPYFTALALWPKGNCWHGGGLFEDTTTVFLNHHPDRATAHPDHQPKGLQIKPNPKPYGEDDPIYSMRLDRDGWQVEQQWQVEFKGGKYTTHQPEVRLRKRPGGKYWIRMTRTLNNLDYCETFEVINHAGDHLIDIPAAEWADWDQRGRLVVLCNGTVQIGTEDIVGHSFHLKQLADLNDHKPEPIPPPKWATHW